MRYACFPRLIAISFAIALSLPPAVSQSLAPALLAPDSRYKADVLLIVAHPDDDVLVAAWLAHIAIDEHKRVAVVYCTRGDGGGNSVGNEAGPALGQMREIEARRALAFLGIESVWFLDGHDTPGQNVLRSLDSWNHGRALDEMVRLVRITRPDVILTWLPHPVVGENHEDHQAAGVLAVEAFDTAADPTQFPEQVSPPRDRTGMANLTEGLQPWQPKKLYFFTDAFEAFGPYWSDPAVLPPFRKTIIDGTGPAFDPKALSPSRHKSYARLSAAQQAFYQTQEGTVVDRAIQSGNFAGFEYPIHFIFGKSLVGGSITGDIFENISATPLSYTPACGYQPEAATGLSLEIGDPWRFYEFFWKAHNLDTLAGLMPEPEISAETGDHVLIDFLACNHSAQSAQINITPELPEGWTDQTKFTLYRVEPGACYPVQAHFSLTAAAKTGWQALTFRAAADTHPSGHVTVHVLVGKSGGLPQ